MPGRFNCFFLLFILLLLSAISINSFGCCWCRCCYTLFSAFLSLLFNSSLFVVFARVYVSLTCMHLRVYLYILDAISFSIICCFSFALHRNCRLFIILLCYSFVFIIKTNNCYAVRLIAFSSKIPIMLVLTERQRAAHIQTSNFPNQSHSSSNNNKNSNKLCFSDFLITLNFFFVILFTLLV